MWDNDDNDFGGDGGYMPNDAKSGDGGGQNGQSTGSNLKASRAIVAVNTFMVKQLTFNNIGYVQFQQKFGTVTLIGTVLSIVENSTRVDITIKDNYSKGLLVRFWRPKDENLSIRDEMPFLKEKAIIRVFGSCRKSLDSPDPQLVAYKVVPVTDLNEITMHNMEVMAHSMMLAKRQRNINERNPCIHKNMFGNHDVPVYNSQTGSGDNSLNKPAGPITPSARPDMKKVPKFDPKELLLKIIKADTSSSGISYDQLHLKTKHFMNRNEVEAAASSLLDDGSLYTTIDENHFKSTD